MKVDIPIDGGFYVSDSLPVSGQQCINVYVNRPQTQTVTTAAIFGTPGIDLLVNVTDSAVNRGVQSLAGIPYTVIGNQLYRINQTLVGTVESYTATALGTVLGSGPVSMADNGTQLAIVSPGVAAYIYTVADGLVAITDANFDGPVDSVEYSKGYFTFATTDGRKFINSPLFDGRGLPNGLAYDALDFSVAEADPDNIAGQVFFNDTLYMLGTQTTEGFGVTSRVPAPFVRIPGAVYQVGIAAPFSVVKMKDFFAFIGKAVKETPSVWAFTGNGYTKISTIAIDNLLSDLTEAQLAQVTSDSYGADGAFFMCFHLPTTTIYYDMTSKVWHERKSLFNDTQAANRAINMVTAYGGIIVGDRYSGKIGKLNKNTYTEYGELIHRRLVARPFDRLGDTFVVHSLELVMETGIGNATVPNPEVRISWSNDGGRTFGDEFKRSFGKVGEYRTRVIYRRQGLSHRSKILAIDFSEPIKFVLVKAEADIG